MRQAEQASRWRRPVAWVTSLALVVATGGGVLLGGGPAAEAGGPRLPGSEKVQEATQGVLATGGGTSRDASAAAARLVTATTGMLSGSLGVVTGTAAGTAGTIAATAGEAAGQLAGALTGGAGGEAVEGTVDQVGQTAGGVAGVLAGDQLGSLVEGVAGTVEGAAGTLTGAILDTAGDLLSTGGGGNQDGNTGSGPSLNLQIGDQNVEVSLDGGLRISPDPTGGLLSGSGGGNGDQGGSGGSGGGPAGEEGDGPVRVDLPTGTITGLVCDALSGLPIPGATVSVGEERGAALGIARTDLGGNFSLDIGRTSSGRLTITASAGGYAVTTSGPITLGPDGTATVKVCLERASTGPQNPPGDQPGEDGDGGSPPGGPGGGTPGPGTEPGTGGSGGGSTGSDPGGSGGTGDERAGWGSLPFTGGNGLAFLLAGSLAAGAGLAVRRWALKGGARGVRAAFGTVTDAGAAGPSPAGTAAGAPAPPKAGEPAPSC
ncbi:carboxypeptidase regulatory-like domain-containing protein [Thermaerobacter sp. PB12/4term]|uniref:carboxypeptidase-like regulatory domain-containing protein n=1 Tax=Thermaerobacter sp. PB12/4term TaxID=2293838 RepID=UPI000E32A11C|nr:carboxypeptidase-like regulatory domain-containing protein [Thermaerobacter sp. PB12/4term]QIA27488.1 carboxypeptidase regulatory-like domain-containing protein [Thermaerobacter sp. PB12/4term]